MALNINAAFQNLREVPSERKYWFLRTYSGILFNTFVEQKYVGIGLNSIPISYIRQASPGLNQHIEPLWEFVKNNSDYRKGAVTRFTNQIIDFVYNMREGDIVVIPSENSDRYAIGEITSTNVTYHNVTGTFDFDGKQEPFPEKRKGVEWLNIISSKDFIAGVGHRIFSRSVITNISFLSDFIEGHISSLFIKEQKAFLMISIDQEHDINAFHFQRFLDGITYFYKEFASELNEDHNEDLFLKIKVQSRGNTMLKGLAIGAVASIGTLIVMSNNPQVDINILGQHVQGSSDGFLPGLTDFLDAKLERRMKYEAFQDSLQALRASRKDEGLSEENEQDQPAEDGEENDG